MRPKYWLELGECGAEWGTRAGEQHQTPYFSCLGGAALHMRVLFLGGLGASSWHGGVMAEGVAGELSCPAPAPVLELMLAFP